MAVGAVYDALLGLGIVLFLHRLSQLLSIPYPGEPIYARMTGVLLIGLAIFYGFAAHQVDRSLRNVAGAILIRALGGFYLIAYTLMGGVPKIFFLFGLVDLIFATWHWTLLRGRARFWKLLLSGDDSS